MKALLLAAGLGSRLGELTNRSSKVLIEINGTSILYHSISKLLEVGVTNILVNVHHFADSVIQELDKHPMRDLITIVQEEFLLGTGGTLIANLEKLSSDDFFVMHCDNYFEDSLKEFLKYHTSTPRSSYMSMLTFETNSPTECGVVTISADSKCISFQEKDPAAISRIANGAVYIFRPSLQSFIESRKDSISDISTDLIPLLVGNFYTFPVKGFYIDIGTPKNLELARDMGKNSHENRK